MAAAMAKCSTLAIAQTSQVLSQVPASEARTGRVAPCQAVGGLRLSPDCAQLQRPQSYRVVERRALTVTNEATTKTPKTPAEADWKIKYEALLRAKVRSVCPRRRQEQGYTIVDVRPEFDFNQEWTPWDIARRAASAFFGIFQGTEENPDFIKEVALQFSSKDSPILLTCQMGGTLKASSSANEAKESRRWAVTKSALAEEPTLEKEESPQGLEKWVIAAEQGFNTFATGTIVNILETLYAKRLYARFYVLETIARVPYFAFVSVLHLYESFGWWRRADYIKVHFAESWNELHHLLVMEALGGDERWIDRFLAQHIAVAYYFMTVLMYLVSPRMAYHFSECVEKHAFSTYDNFIKSHGDELKLLPAPEVAVQYYTKGDLYMFDEFQTDIEPNSRRPTIENLYDVFVNIREDEAQHCKTMQACQTAKSLRSPHRDAPLTEVANDNRIPYPADCEGIFECATTASSYADRARKQGVEKLVAKIDGSDL